MVRYVFLEWRDQVGNVWATPSISLLIDTDKTLTAYYEEVPVVTYILTVATTVGGNTDPIPGAYEYDEGASATVTAIPNTGYTFSHWILDGVTRTENPTVVTMDKNYKLTAYFEPIPPPEYTLTISTTLGGTTDPTPGTYTYVEGQVVAVTAIPDTDYNFNHWILDGVTYTSNPINVPMDKDKTLTAYFSLEPPPPPDTYKLTISSTIGGTTDPPTGIHEYDEGLTVTVTAFPENGYHFNHWELDGAVKSGTPINVLMDKDHTLLAVFSEEVPPPPIPSWVIFGGLTVVGAIILSHH